MSIRGLALGIAGLVLLAGARPAAAEDAVDALVRSDARLAALDRQLSDVVAWAARPASAGHAALHARQAAWSENRRACLSDADPVACLADRYAVRIATVSAASGWPPARPPILMRCRDGKPLTFVIAYWATDPSTLTAQHRGLRIAMVQQPSGSGVRYAGDGAAYAEHQGEAQITWPGHSEPLACHWRAP